MTQDEREAAVERALNLPRPVPAAGKAPDDLAAAGWSAAAEFQLQEIKGCVDKARIDVERVHAYAQTALDDIEHTVGECQREAARTLHLYKMGIYDSAKDYETVEYSQPEVAVPEPATTSHTFRWDAGTQELRGDGPLARDARDKARANRVANRPVFTWLSAAVISAAATAAGMYGYGEWTKAIPPLPAPAVERLEAPKAEVVAEPAMVLVNFDIGEGGIIFLSSTTKVVKDGENWTYFADFTGPGPLLLPEGTFVFMVGWGPGDGIVRGVVEVKGNGGPQTLKVNKPVKAVKKERET